MGNPGKNQKTRSLQRTVTAATLFSIVSCVRGTVSASAWNPISCSAAMMSGRIRKSGETMVTKRDCHQRNFRALIYGVVGLFWGNHIPWRRRSDKNRLTFRLSGLILKTTGEVTPMRRLAPMGDRIKYYGTRTLPRAFLSPILSLKGDSSPLWIQL